MNTNNIKKLRRAKNMSVTELATLLNMSQSNLTKIENGQVELRRDVMQQIAEILNVSPMALTEHQANFSPLATELTLINPEQLDLPPLSKLPIPAFSIKQALETLAIYVATDDAMMPIIPPFSLVLIDTSIKTFTSDGTYLFKVNNTLVLRRLQNTFSSEINIISEHKAYPPQHIDKSKIEIQGRAISIFNIKQI